MKKLAFVGTFIAVVTGAGWTAYTHWSSQPDKPAIVINLVDEGNSFLNIGHYGEAKQSFQKAFAIDPQDEQAAWGLKKAELWDAKDTATFEQNLHNLYEKNPNDAHVNLFYGKLYGATHDAEKALPYYQKAIAINTNLAEAHFDLGVLYEQKGKTAEAKEEYEQAVSLRAMPKYQDNLAHMYFKQGDYNRAMETYGKISNYPQSALELAKIYWIRGEPQQAESYQRQALQLLNDEQLMSKTENQEPWYFEVDNKGLELIQLAEKKDYAHFCLSVSLYLQGKDNDAKLELNNLRSIRQAEIKDIITADLNRLARANSHFSEQVAAYQTIFSTTR
jgi:tetratricopeptide (TPR) repeat protein